MADRTIRAVYEVNVDKAVNNLKRAGKEMGSLEKESQRLEKELRDLSGVEVNPKIGVEISKAQKALKTFQNDLSKMEGFKATPKIDTEISDSLKRIGTLQNQLRKLEQKKPTLDVILEASKAQSEIDILSRRIGKLQDERANVQVTADARKAAAELSRLENKVADLKSLRARMNIVADAREAEKVISDAQNDLRSLDGKKATVMVGADNRAGKLLDSAKSDVKSLDGSKATVQVNADASNAQKNLGAVKSDVRGLDGAKARIKVTADKPDLSKIYQSASAEGKKAGSVVGSGLISGIKGAPVVAAVAGVLGSAGIAGVSAFNKAFDKVAIDTKIGASLGLTDKEVQRYSVIAGKTYASGFGESYEAAMDSMKFVKINELIGADATEADMTRVNKVLLNTADLLGEDVANTAEAAGAMIKNGLAKNSQEAFDILQTGMQSGMNRSHDMLDTFREYPTMFASLGFSAQDMGKVLSQAMQAGAYNTDYAADALKEFSIRAQDGSKSTAEGFEAIGLNAEEMSQKFAEGGASAREVFNQTMAGLRSLDDPLQRNIAGVALFGTKWEDAGNGAQIMAMNLEATGTSFDKVAGAAERAMERMESSVANRSLSAQRSLEMAWQSASSSMLAALEPQISQFATYISQNTHKVLEFFKMVGNAALSAAIPMAQFGALAIEHFGRVASAGGFVVEILGHIVKGMGVLSMNRGIQAMGDAMVKTGQNAGELSAQAQGLADHIRGNVVPGLEQARDKFNNMIDPAIARQKAQDAVTQITGSMQQLVAQLRAMPFDIKINGNTVPAEQALDRLMVAIQNSPDGMVTINGNKVPAEQALATFMQEARNNHGEVNIGANTEPGKAEVKQFVFGASQEHGDVQVGANTNPGRASLGAFASNVSETRSDMQIGGNTNPGEASLGAFASNVTHTSRDVSIGGNTDPGQMDLRGLTDTIDRTRASVEIGGNTHQGRRDANSLIRDIDGARANVDVGANTNSARVSVGSLLKDIAKSAASVLVGLRRAHGGFVETPGRAAGGWVGAPRTLPGKDNVLYPLAYGGRTLMQPLAGGEFVVNAKDSARNRDLLQYLNKGGTLSLPASSGVDTGAIASAVASAIASAPIVAEVRDSRTAASIVTMGQRHIR